jgi:hypothetical protein
MVGTAPLKSMRTRQSILPLEPLLREAGGHGGARGLQRSPGGERLLLVMVTVM